MRWLSALLLCLLPLAAAAQDDRGWIVGWLEENLSGAGRDIRLEGFAGALSSRATFDSLTIADAEGVWLTIAGGAISWNRSALLGGRVEIAEMSAEAIDLVRLPAAEGGVSAEAKGFALPELPVSVDIDAVRATRVTLGEAVLGQPVAVSLQAALTLAGGDGNASLTLQRIDGRRGEIELTGSYLKATRQATLDLLADEAEGGIAASLIGLPGVPAATLAVHASGPVDDFRADVALTTAGVPRLSGAVTLKSEADAAGAPPRRSFRAELGGDVAPLFLPDYQAFFGDAVQLVAEGAQTADGGLTLSRLQLDARALRLSGALDLAAGGMPRRAALDLGMGLADGTPVLLPLAGDKTTVKSAALRLTYDAARDDGWTLKGDLRGLSRPDIDIAALRLDGSGRIAPAPRNLVGGTVSFVAGGLVPADPALAEALGPVLSGRLLFHRQGGGPLNLPQFRVTGQGYSAEGGLSIAGLDSGLTVTGRAFARLSDIARLSSLARRPLTGQAEIALTGSAGLLSGFLDAEATVVGNNLTLAQPELDGLLAGGARIKASVKRDETGTELRGLSVAAQALTAEASGRLWTGGNDLKARLKFFDLSVLGRGWGGSLEAEATHRVSDGEGAVTASASGEALTIGQPQADRLLAGRSDLSLSARIAGSAYLLDAVRLSNPQVSVAATAKRDSGGARYDVEARLADVALVAPGFQGPATIGGEVARSQGYRVDLNGSGPGGTTAQVTGSLAEDFATADLRISGGAEAALANAFIAPRSVQGPLRFDLALSGPPALSSLSGTIALTGARIVAPVLGYATEATDVTARLAGGRVDLDASARLTSGGTLGASGGVSLTAPYPADLSVTIARAKLRDPNLFQTVVDGRLGISGPLAGGATISGTLTLDETEISIAATGLGGLDVIPEITHLAEPAAVRATRGRAGLLDTGGGASVGRPFPLDITLSAPRRIFVRGRGLDAELGGALRLQGTTTDIRPSGAFNLVRGRLDILGKRFTLDEGLVQLQGSFVPFIAFAASTVVDGITATIGIEGEATAPEIAIRSAPELPEEEVLALILFGRGLTTLSPFQAAQLASAVATLAGKGGGGIVGRLREGFGLDDLDVTTDEAGGTAVRAGKYLSENLYTDVTVGSDGKSEINLNFDISPSFTARGTLGSEGNTGLGIYFERDY